MFRGSLFRSTVIATPRRRKLNSIIATSLWLALAWLAACSTAEAKTLVLTDSECEQVAVISEEAPRLGWAATGLGDGAFSNFYIELTKPRAFLIRYPLDRIPPGQKILNAEWTIPLALVYPKTNPRFNVQRLLLPWGAGVCHEYRQVLPTKEKWHAPGATAPGLDRAAKPSASMRLGEPNKFTLNVTQDVELWYSRQAPSEGWIVSIDDPNCMVRLNCPTSTPGLWVLRVTYEPE